MDTRQLWKVGALVLVLLTLIGAASISWAGSAPQDTGSEDGALETAGGPHAPNVSQVVGDEPDEDGYDGPVDLGSASSMPPSESKAPGGEKPAWSLSGLQPDEDGYAGPVVLRADAGFPSSEPNVGDAPNWDQFFLEPQPDDNDLASIASPDWSPFYYIFAAGSTMRPRDSSTTWDYPGVGCVSAASGGNLFTLHLDLPEGSRIDYLRIFFYDTSASNSTAWITTYNGAGAFDDIVTVTSSGNGGYGTALSAYLGEVVNNQDNSYVLNWQPNQTGSTMQLCGLRVAFRLPD